MPGTEMAQAGPDATRRGWGRLALLILLGLPLAIVAADRVIVLSQAAQDACGDIGLVPGFEWMFSMAWMVPAMWAAWSIPIAMGRRHLLPATIVGLLLVAAISLWWLSGTSEAIIPYGDKFCPGGVPTWWPAWLPR